MNIKVLQPNSEEYVALELATSALNFIFQNEGMKFAIQNVYFDYGQDWKWTTIVCYRDGKNSYQLLSPKDWELITTCTDTVEMMNIVDSLKVIED